MNNTELYEAVKKHFNTNDVVTGKGGYFVKGQGFISIAKARRLTGIKAQERNFKPRMSAYGDYAWIAKINRISL